MAKNKSILVYLLCFISCISYAQQSNPGLVRNGVTKTYLSQVGIRELTGHNDGVAVEMYLHYCHTDKGEPWCASFVCWTLGQNKVSNPRNAYCPALFLPNNRVWQRNAKTNGIPQHGDVWGIYFVDRKRIAHVGFVDKWGSETTVTVEGNTNEAGSREGDGVYRKKRLTRQLYEVTNFIK